MKLIISRHFPDSVLKIKISCFIACAAIRFTAWRMISDYFGSIGGYLWFACWRLQIKVVISRDDKNIA
jgi:hypothetical protein